MTSSQWDLSGNNELQKDHYHRQEESEKDCVEEAIVNEYLSYIISKIKVERKNKPQDAQVRPRKDLSFLL